LQAELHDQAHVTRRIHPKTKTYQKSNVLLSMQNLFVNITYKWFNFTTLRACGREPSKPLFLVLPITLEANFPESCSVRQQKSQLQAAKQAA
jgi:hypothetical protein